MPQSSTASEHPIRLLFVDDDDGLLKMFGGNLEHLGYEVVTATSSDSARTAVKKHPFDIALLDVMMQGGADGVYLSAWIHAECPDLPLVLFSGLADAEMIADGMKHGAAEFIRKPVVVHELDRKLRGVLAKTRMNSGAEGEQEENQSADEVNQSTDGQQTEAVPAEREQILAALKDAGGHLGRAAKILGYSYSTLQRKMKQLGIKRGFK